MNTMEVSVRIFRTSVILQERFREMEDQLDLERQARLRAERSAQDFNLHLNVMNQQLDEYAKGQSHELLQQRELEVNKLRKKLQEQTLALETSEHVVKRKHQQLLNEFTNEIDTLHKKKGKAEQERQQLAIQVQTCYGQLDDAMRGKQSCESKLEAMSSQMSKLKSLTDDMQKQLVDMHSQKTSLQSENFKLRTELQDAHLQIISVSKAKETAQSQLSAAKKSADEAEAAKTALSCQVTTLRTELDSSKNALELEADECNSLRAQMKGALAEHAMAKARLQSEVSGLNDELDELRRRMNIRVNELQDELDHERARANSLEKMKGKLLIEIEELNIIIEELQNENADLNSKLKDALADNDSLKNQLNELNLKCSRLAAENDKLKGDNDKLKAAFDKLQAKCDALEKENKGLQDAAKNALATLEDAKKRMADLEAENGRLKDECDGLMGALNDAKDALKESQMQANAGGMGSASYMSELRDQLAGKQAELDALRKSLGDKINHLTNLISEMESKHKAELARLRRKYEAIIAELQAQLDAQIQANQNLVKENKNLLMRLKDLETSLQIEKQAHEDDLIAAQANERRRLQLANELDELQSVFDRQQAVLKTTKSDLESSVLNNSQLSLSIATMTKEKQQVEQQISELMNSYENCKSAKQSAEERVEQMTGEVARYTEELQMERDAKNNIQVLKSKLETEIRELNSEIDLKEASHNRELKRQTQQNATRIRELEAQIEGEQQRVKDAAFGARKFERMYKDGLAQGEHDRRQIVDLQSALDKAEIRVKSYKRQLEEADQLNLTKQRSVKVKQDDSNMDFIPKTMTVRRVLLSRRGASSNRDLAARITRATSIL